MTREGASAAGVSTGLRDGLSRAPARLRTRPRARFSLGRRPGGDRSGHVVRGVPGDGAGRAGTGPRSFTPSDVADLVGVDEARILAALERHRAAFFPHATHSPGEGWSIPAADVRQLLGGSLEPLLTIRQFSDLVGLRRETVSRAISAGHIRTVGPAWLDAVRIPSSEYWRFRGDREAPQRI